MNILASNVLACIYGSLLVAATKTTKNRANVLQI